MIGECRHTDIKIPLRHSYPWEAFWNLHAQLCPCLCYRSTENAYLCSSILWRDKGHFSCSVWEAEVHSDKYHMVHSKNVWGVSLSWVELEVGREAGHHDMGTYMTCILGSILSCLTNWKATGKGRTSKWVLKRCQCRGQGQVSIPVLPASILTTRAYFGNPLSFRDVEQTFFWCGECGCGRSSLLSMVEELISSVWFNITIPGQQPPPLTA